MKVNFYNYTEAALIEQPYRRHGRTTDRKTPSYVRLCSFINAIYHARKASNRLRVAFVVRHCTHTDFHIDIALLRVPSIQLTELSQ